MEEQLLAFSKQFSWEPNIVGSVPAFDTAIVCGMGGSALQARLLHAIDPSLPFSIHQDYGLPFIADGAQPLIILSSHSGETEEVLDAAKEASERGFPRVIVASRGALLEQARAENIPFIQLPKDDTEPRMAIGYAMLALLRVLGKSEHEAKLRAAGSALDTKAILAEGKKTELAIQNRIPLIYASTANSAIAYCWKITFNETAKSPAFTNMMPELCHNELCGFDVVPSTVKLSHHMVGVFLHDDADHPRNEKRLTLVEEIMREKGIATMTMTLKGADRYQKMLTGVLAAVAAAIPLAKTYGVPDAAVPLITLFKGRMKE